MAQIKDPFSPEVIALCEQYVHVTRDVIQSTIGTYANSAVVQTGSCRPVLASAVETAIDCIATYEAAERKMRGVPRTEHAQLVEVDVDVDTILFYALMCAAKVVRHHNPPAESPVHVIRQAADWLSAIKGDAPLPDWAAKLRDTCDEKAAAYEASKAFPAPAGNA